MMKFEISRLLPPGLSPKSQIRTFIALCSAGIVHSLIFFVDLQNARNQIYRYIDGQRYLVAGSVMQDFSELIKGHLDLFWLLILVMLGYAVFYYLSYYRHSKSIYTMRRIGKPWELHCRCWSLPVLLALAGAVIAFVLLVLYFGIYMLVTPTECLTPDQWGKIWRELL